MGAETEEYVLQEADFFAQREIIRKQILDNAKLTGAQKRMTLTVLDAFAQSVRAGGVRQHDEARAPAQYRRGSSRDPFVSLALSPLSPAVYAHRRIGCHSPHSPSVAKKNTGPTDV